MLGRPGLEWEVSLGTAVRIALVVPEFPPHGIGGGAVVFEALRAEYRARHDVRVFTGHDLVRGWSAPALADAHDPDVVRYPLVPLATARPHLRTVVPPGVRAAADLRRDLTTWAPDVAHIHGYGYAIVDLAALLLRNRRVPYVFTNHGYPATPNSRGAAVQFLYGAYRRLGAERTVAGAAVVTAISRSVLHRGAVAGRGVVVPNGLTALPVSTDEGRSRLRTRLGLAPEVRVVAAAGRLSSSKGFDVLLDAVSKLALPDVACVVAGLDGGAGALLRQQARYAVGTTGVALPGPLTRQELADLFSLASVVAVPSRIEPFGLVALEAAAHGTRVVASAVGGLPEFLPTDLARLVDPDDPDALASAIREAFAKGPLTSDESRSAAELATRHDWHLIGARYEGLLYAAVAGRSKRIIESAGHP